jgi:hypothetical protein
MPDYERDSLTIGRIPKVGEIVAERIQRKDDTIRDLDRKLKAVEVAMVKVMKVNRKLVAEKDFHESKSKTLIAENKGLLSKIESLKSKHRVS